MQIGALVLAVVILFVLLGVEQYAKGRTVEMLRRLALQNPGVLITSCRLVNPWMWMPCVILLRKDRIEIERAMGGLAPALYLDRIGRIEVDEFLATGRPPSSGEVLRIAHLGGTLEFVSEELGPWKDWAMSFQGADLEALRATRKDGTARTALSAESPQPRTEPMLRRSAPKTSPRLPMAEPAASGADQPARRTSPREEQAAGQTLDPEVIDRLSRRLTEPSLQRQSQPDRPPQGDKQPESEARKQPAPRRYDSAELPKETLERLKRRLEE